jgi:hypothetical protein
MIYRKRQDGSMRRYPYKFDQVLPLGILIILIGVNAAWYVFSKQSGSLVALIFYSVIFFLCWRMLDFRAVIIAGSIGFGVHLYEWVFLDFSEFQLPDTLLFYLNLVLPIPLAYFGYRLYRANR